MSEINESPTNWNVFFRFSTGLAPKCNLRESELGPFYQSDPPSCDVCIVKVTQVQRLEWRCQIRNPKSDRTICRTSDVIWNVICQRFESETDWNWILVLAPLICSITQWVGRNIQTSKYKMIVEMSNIEIPNMPNRGTPLTVAQVKRFWRVQTSTRSPPMDSCWSGAVKPVWNELWFALMIWFNHCI